jgi:hypothetical protein
MDQVLKENAVAIMKFPEILDNPLWRSNMKTIIAHYKMKNQPITAEPEPYIPPPARNQYLAPQFPPIQVDHQLPEHFHDQQFVEPYNPMENQQFLHTTPQIIHPEQIFNPEQMLHLYPLLQQDQLGIQPFQPLLSDQISQILSAQLGPQPREPPNWEISGHYNLQPNPFNDNLYRTLETNQTYGFPHSSVPVTFGESQVPNSFHFPSNQLQSLDYQSGRKRFYEEIQPNFQEDFTDYNEEGYLAKCYRRTL